MATHTFQARLCAGLEALGHHKVEAKTRKYIAYAHKSTSHFLFVGKAGALRGGSCATQSVSIGEPGNQTHSYKTVLEAGDKKLATTQPTSVSERLSTLD